MGVKKNLKTVFGLKLKELRAKAGLSQSALGEKLDLDQEQVSQYERGQVWPDPDAIQRIAEYFKVSAAYLLGAEAPTGNIVQYFNEERDVLKQQIAQLSQLVEKQEDTHKTLADLRKSLMREIKIKDDLIKTSIHIA